MKRFIVRFSMCREGQVHDPNLFTDDIETAELWSTLPDIVVFDRENNYSHVVVLDVKQYEFKDTI